MPGDVGTRQEREETIKTSHSNYSSSGEECQEKTTIIAEYAGKLGYKLLGLYGIVDGRCECGRPDCPSPGKHPLPDFFPNGVKDATDNVDYLLECLHRHPNMNLGLAMGANELVAIDFDDLGRLKEFMERYGIHENFTTVQYTGRGCHLIFKVPQGVTGPFRRNLDEKVDVKGGESYIVFSPSTHVSGKRYQIVNPHVKPAEIPQILLQEIVNRGYSDRNLNQSLDDLDDALSFLYKDVRETIKEQIIKIVDILQPYWNDGVRHNLSLGLAGLFARQGVPRKWAEPIFNAIISRLPNNHYQDRLRTLDSTYNKENECEISGATLLTQNGVPQTKVEKLVKAIKTIARIFSDIEDIGDDRVVLPYNKINPTRTTKLVEDFLNKTESPFFVYTNKVMQLEVDQFVGTGKIRSYPIYKLIPASKDVLIRYINERVVFYCREQKQWMTCPERVVRDIMTNLSTLNRLVGIIYTPYLDLNTQELICKKGYNPKYQLYLAEDFTDLEIPEKPTEEEARKALQNIRDFLKIYVRFQTEFDEAVAVSLLFTVVLRHSLGFVPAYIITAALPGSGKTLLTHIVNMIALGRPANNIAPTSYDAIEKQINSHIIQGETIINIDNMNAHSIRSNMLASFTTNPTIDIREFLTLRSVTLPNKQTFIFNGNNLTVAEDSQRRFLICKLTRRQEGDPDLVSIDESKRTQAFEYIQNQRKKILQNIYTVVKYFIQNTAAKYKKRMDDLIEQLEEENRLKKTEDWDKDPEKQVAVFYEWSIYVRQLLIYFGLPDVLESKKRMEQEDLTTLDYVQLLHKLHWFQRVILAKAKEFSSRQITAFLRGEELDEFLAHSSITYRRQREEFREVIEGILGKEVTINPKNITKVLRRIEEQVFDGLKVVYKTTKKGVMFFSVEEVNKTEDEVIDEENNQNENQNANQNVPVYDVPKPKLVYVFNGFDAASNLELLRSFSRSYNYPELKDEETGEVVIEAGEEAWNKKLDELEKLEGEEKKEKVNKICELASKLQ